MDILSPQHRKEIAFQARFVKIIPGKTWDRLLTNCLCRRSYTLQIWKDVKDVTVLFKNRRTLKFRAAFTTALFVAVNHNYDHKQRTLTHGNTQNGSKSTNHESWPFEPVEINYCFLRGPLRWLTQAKNANVSWLLNFRICVILKSAVKAVEEILEDLTLWPNLYYRRIIRLDG